MPSKLATQRTRMKPTASLRGKAAAFPAYRHGFTLIEAVLSIGILGMAMILLISLFAPTTNAISRVQRQQEISQAVAICNTQIEHHMSWDELVDALTSESNYALIWKQQTHNKQPPSTQLGGMWGDEDLTTLQSAVDNNTLTGSPFLIILEQSQINHYDYTATEKASHIPVCLKLYPIYTPENISIAQITTHTPTLSYTTVKLR